ncbi:MAG: hypothetical protein HY319_08910 [Armatimonadetes bacterium]|nr:hypothetical protein [Armatimonadota bacterium]
MRFRYRAHERQTGRVHRGTLEAVDKAAALAALAFRDYLVQELEAEPGVLCDETPPTRGPSPRPREPSRLETIGGELRRGLSEILRSEEGLKWVVLGLLLLMAWSLFQFVLSLSARSEAPVSSGTPVQLEIRGKLPTPESLAGPSGSITRVHVLFPEIPYEVETRPGPDREFQVRVDLLSPRPATHFHVDVTENGKRRRVVSRSPVTGPTAELPILEPEDPGTLSERSPRQRPRRTSTAPRSRHDSGQAPPALRRRHDKLQRVWQRKGQPDRKGAHPR